MYFEYLSLFSVEEWLVLGALIELQFITHLLVSYVHDSSVIYEILSNISVPVSCNLNVALKLKDFAFQISRLQIPTLGMIFLYQNIAILCVPWKVKFTPFISFFRELFYAMTSKNTLLCSCCARFVFLHNSPLYCIKKSSALAIPVCYWPFHPREVVQERLRNSLIFCLSVLSFS